MLSFRLPLVYQLNQCYLRYEYGLSNMDKDVLNRQQALRTLAAIIHCTQEYEKGNCLFLFPPNQHEGFFLPG